MKKIILISSLFVSLNSMAALNLSSLAGAYNMACGAKGFSVVQIKEAKDKSGKVNGVEFETFKPKEKITFVNGKIETKFDSRRGEGIKAKGIKGKIQGNKITTSVYVVTDYDSVEVYENRSLEVEAGGGLKLVREGVVGKDMTCALLKLGKR